MISKILLARRIWTQKRATAGIFILNLLHFHIKQNFYVFEMRATLLLLKFPPFWQKFPIFMLILAFFEIVDGNGRLEMVSRVKCDKYNGAQTF